MLENKNALVTGSTSGIGLGIATILAQHGCNILLNGIIEQDELKKIVKDLEIFGNKIIYSNANLKSSTEIKKMAELAKDEFGSVDILINNAGIQRVSPIEQFDDEAWDDVIAVNLNASFHTIKACLPMMRANKWGRIINIASAHGLVASINKSAYVAAKHGIIGLTKVVALETAKENITCNAICPGWVLTPLVQKQINDRAKEKQISIEESQNLLLAEKQPSMQFVTPSQIGNLVTFLCSEAASQIKGASLSMDGGWTAQ